MMMLLAQRDVSEEAGVGQMHHFPIQKLTWVEMVI